MKIKKLILENINSLYGRWTIDFDDPVFEDGIFAISGPTGSGKTTILDAICLALYTETPRINGRGANIGEVISKGASGCLAELTFETDGRIYQAAFGFGTYLKGPKKGQVNESRKFHTLSSGGKILSEKLNETRNEIIRITGMNGEQFCRAALLAQGQFDAFLLAGEKKAETLEQITGTGIYSDIAGKIHEKSSALAQRIQLEKEKLDAAELPDPETEQLKRNMLEKLNQQHDAGSTRKKQLEELLRIFDRSAANETLLTQNAEAAEQLAAHKQRFADSEKRLANAEKAIRIRPAFQIFSELERLQRADSETRSEILNRMPALKSGLERKKNLVAESGNTLQRQINEQERIARLAARADALDHQSVMLKNELEDFLSRLKDAEKKRSEILGAMKEVSDRLTALETEKQSSEKYVADHPHDELLPERNAQWLEQLRNLRSVNRELSVREQEYRDCVRAEEAAGNQVRNQEALLADAEKKLAAARGAETEKQQCLTGILAGNTRETLEEKREILIRNQNLFREILSYEEARKKLADGEECPLCGSREHPFAVGNIPVLSQNEADLAAVRIQLKACLQAEKELHRAQELRLTTEKNRENCFRESELARLLASQKKNDRRQRETALGQLRSDANRLTDSLRNGFSEFQLAWDGQPLPPPEIQNRIKNWQDAVRKLNSFVSAKSVLENELQNRRRQAEESDQEISDLNSRMAAVKPELDSIRTERFALFGEKDTAQELQSAQRKLNEAQDNYTCCTNELSAAEESVRINEQKSAELQQRSERREPELRKAGSNFLAACEKEGMTPESFQAALLPDQELTALTAERARLLEQEKNLSEQKIKLETERTALRQMLPESSSRPELSAEQTGLQKLLDENRRQSGALQNELERYDRIRGEQAERMKALDRLRQTASVWSELDALIGGSNGQRFRRVAQGITLDHLLVKANEMLVQMNDRYELIRSAAGNSLLDIDIIDHFQGDGIRTCSNLSGGERFQVSLALALALSSMAGEKIRIDSLFLDEGFGTLDPDSLETALNTLSTLRQREGKTIGIISHIRNIGENIPAVIEVVPGNGGRSRLCGAGVSCL